MVTNNNMLFTHASEKLQKEIIIKNNKLIINASEKVQ